MIPRARVRHRQAPKAIETRYAGCRFRSRLEARWAVFLDTLGIEWEYESQGYHVGALSYLPDFFLPRFGKYLEVKGGEPPQGDVDKVLALAEGVAGQGFTVTLLQGDIPRQSATRTIGGIPTRMAIAVDGAWRLEPHMWLLDKNVRKVDGACERARSARFEHGECG